MLYGFTPKWLDKIERHARWLAIPNLALLLVGLQVVGFFLVLIDPRWWGLLVLDPRMVLQGELWRLIGFLALPVSVSPLWMVFALYFLYFIVNGIESEWGAFRTTFYVLVCLALTVVFSFIFDFPITSVSYVGSTLFFAAAAIAPEFEILLFFILPVKLKWLAWISLAFVVLRLVAGTWLDRLYLLTIYANYLLFFGPYHWWQFKQWQRRSKFKEQYRDRDNDEE
jgi:hypothetical protein